MGAVFVKCAATEQPVPTGHRMTEAQLETANGAYAFRCRICNEIHAWKSEDAWVESRPDKLRGLAAGHRARQRT